MACLHPVGFHIMHNLSHSIHDLCDKLEHGGGSTHRGPHPRLWGLRTPDGQWATKKAAEYTSEFAAALAKCIAVIQPPSAEGFPAP